MAALSVEPVEHEESLVGCTTSSRSPQPEEAPSDLGVMGRYVLTPAIFDALGPHQAG